MTKIPVAQPILTDNAKKYPVSESLAKNGICLPSGLTLKNTDVYLIAKIVN